MHATRKSITTRSSLVAALMLAGMAHANAMDASCNIVEKRFVCADGSKSAQKIFEAMASPATTKNLQEAKVGLLQTPKEREAFRRSLERAREAANRHADQSLRQMRRRKISAEKYETIRSQFGGAMANYNAAFNIFSQRDWYSPARDKNAEGSE